MSRTNHLRKSSNNNRNPSRNTKPRRRNSWPSLLSLDETLHIIFPTPVLNRCVELICGSEAKYLFLRQKDLKAWASHPTSIANAGQSAASANGATTGVRQGTPSSASALWTDHNFRAKYWARQNETSSRPVTALTDSTAALSPNKSHDRTVSGSTLVSFPSPQDAENKKRMDELAAADLPPPPSPAKKCPLDNRIEDPVQSPPKSATLPDVCKFKRTPLLPGQEPFVPVAVFSQQWDLPTAVIETNHPMDPRLQEYLRKYKIEAVLRPDFMTISTHARTSSKEQEAMDEFVRRPDCRIDPQYLDPVLAREKRQRMAEQAMISNIPQPVQQKISSQRKASGRRGSGGKRPVDVAAQQEEMARQANAAYEAQQKANNKKVAPVMERSSKRRGSVAPVAPTKQVALPVVAEECDEWDPSWVVEPAKA